MQLSALVTDISEDLNRSNITAAQIRSKIRSALLTLEQANNWAYMDRFVEFTLDLTSENPRAMPMPADLKNIEFIRFWVDDEWNPIKEVQPADILTHTAGYPEGYFKDAMSYIWLDKTPDEAYEGEMSYRQFTTWSDADAFEPWPFKWMWNVVKYQTLVMMGPFLRDPEFMKMNADLLAQALKTTVDSNEEMEYSNRDNQMKYR